MSDTSSPLMVTVEPGRTVSFMVYMAVATSVRSPSGVSREMGLRGMEISYSMGSMGCWRPLAVLTKGVRVTVMVSPTKSTRSSYQVWSATSTVAKPPVTM